MVKTENHIILISAAVIVLSLLYFYFDPGHSAIFPPCPFHFATGLYCPGCGSQRAFHALMHGHFLESAGYNVLLILFLPLIIIGAIRGVRNVFLHRGGEFILFQSTVFSRAVVLIVLLFWVLRNLPYYPLSLLAP